MTAYTTGEQDLVEAIEKASQIFNPDLIDEASMERAKKIIVQQTLDAAPMTTRRLKLLYKHTAFGADLVKTTEEYIAAVQSYTIEDLRRFADTYYVAGNAVLVLTGRINDNVKEAVQRCFGSVPRGQKTFRAVPDIYTGGFGHLVVDDETVRLMFGWDIQHLTVSESPAVNVMMSMFLRRLERAYAEAGIDDAYVELKIAGYYGLRTMRVFIASHNATPRELTSIFIKALNRICDTHASDERMERSRNAAMTEKLDKYERTDDAALEVAWQLVGRGNMYDVTNRIRSIWETSAHDVKLVARSVFRTGVPTYIVAAQPDADFYSYQDLKALIGD
jgi:predicted Zn-dependent peptidase